MRIHANRLDDIKYLLTSYLAYFCHTNKDSFIGKMSTTEEKLNQLNKDCDRDNFMTAEQALEYGLISEIYLFPRHKKALDEMRELGFLNR